MEKRMRTGESDMCVGGGGGGGGGMRKLVSD